MIMLLKTTSLVVLGAFLFTGLVWGQNLRPLAAGERKSPKSSDINPEDQIALEALGLNAEVPPRFKQPEEDTFPKELGAPHVITWIRNVNLGQLIAGTFRKYLDGDQGALSDLAHTVEVATGDRRLASLIESVVPPTAGPRSTVSRGSDKGGVNLQAFQEINNDYLLYAGMILDVCYDAEQDRNNLAVYRANTNEDVLVSTVDGQKVFLFYLEASPENQRNLAGERVLFINAATVHLAEITQYSNSLWQFLHDRSNYRPIFSPIPWRDRRFNRIVHDIMLKAFPPGADITLDDVLNMDIRSVSCHEIGHVLESIYGIQERLSRRNLSETFANLCAIAHGDEPHYGLAAIAGISYGFKDRIYSHAWARTIHMLYEIAVQEGLLAPELHWFDAESGIMSIVRQMFASMAKASRLMYQLEMLGRLDKETLRNLAEKAKAQLIGKEKPPVSLEQFEPIPADLWTAETSAMEKPAAQSVPVPLYTEAFLSQVLRPLAAGERGEGRARLIQASDERYGYFMMDYNLRYKGQQGVSTSVISYARQQAEESLGRYRNFSRPPSGYEVLISDQEIEELARVLEGLGLGFIFEDGLTYARTFCPHPTDFVHTIGAIVAPVRTSRQTVTLRVEIAMQDMSLDLNLRNNLVERLNFDLYPHIRVETYEGGYTHFENELKLILGRMSPAHQQQVVTLFKLSLDSVQQRNLPSPSMDTAKRLASTLFFHEIGEMLFATLPHDLRERWRRLINTPGTRLVPGILVFKNQLKMIQQATMNINSPIVVPDRPEEENFADIFAMAVYPDNVYTAFGETLKPEWKAFIKEVLHYLRHKHRQGRNVWAMEDPEKIQEYERMEVVVERDPFKADARQELADLIRPFLEAQIGANAAGFNKTLRNIVFNLSKVEGSFTAQNVNLAFQTAKVNLLKGKPGEIAGRLNQTSDHSGVPSAIAEGTIPRDAREALEISILRPLAAYERKQYEHPLGANPHIEPDLESLKLTLSNLIEWLKKKGYPPKFLDYYKVALEHAELVQIDLVGFFLAKDAGSLNPYTGLPQVYFYSPGLYNRLRSRVSHIHDFVTLAMTMPREAKGLAIAYLLNKDIQERLAKIDSLLGDPTIDLFERQIAQIMQTHPAMSRDPKAAAVFLLRNLDKYPRLSEFLTTHRGQITDLAADVLAGECLEAIEHATALNWGAENGLFDFSQAKFTGENEKQLFLSGGRLDNVLAIELSNLGSRHLNHWLQGQGRQNRAMRCTVFFMLSEICSFLNSGGKEGFNPANIDIIMKENVAPAEKFSASVALLLEPVSRRVEILEQRLSGMELPSVLTVNAQTAESPLSPPRENLLTELNQAGPPISLAQLNDLLDRVLPGIHPMYIRAGDIMTVQVVLTGDRYSFLTPAQIKRLLNYFQTMPGTFPKGTPYRDINACI